MRACASFFFFSLASFLSSGIEARSLTTCLFRTMQQASSWAARAVHKGMTGLTHKTDKYGRGRKTAMKMALQQALGQVKEARAEEGGER